MKNIIISFFLLFSGTLAFATVSQNFESGEDTSEWGSSWQAPAGWSITAPGFLDAGLGGSNSGGGTTADGQNANREFFNNTGGVDTDGTYTTSMYLTLSDFGTVPANGAFYVVDGDYDQGGSANVVQFRITGGTNEWEYFDYGGGGWTDTGVTWSLNDINYIEYTFDNVNNLYDFTLSEVNTSGVVVGGNTADFSSISAGTTTNPGQWGQLTYHFETSAGTAAFQVDNINIVVPEASSVVLMVVALTGVFLVVHRKRS